MSHCVEWYKSLRRNDPFPRDRKALRLSYPHISIRVAVPVDLSFTVFPAVESDGLLQLVALGNDRKRKRGGEGEK